MFLKMITKKNREKNEIQEKEMENEYLNEHLSDNQKIAQGMCTIVEGNGKLNNSYFHCI